MSNTITLERIDRYARASALYLDRADHDRWDELSPSRKATYYGAVHRQLVAMPSGWRDQGVQFTVTDLFCGAGGSTDGAESVAGIRVRMASNHWRLALDTHNHNHPHVDHDIEDINEADPRRFPTTDFLWVSPSCTFWSIAQGKKQTFAHDPTDPALFDLADFDDEGDEPGSAEAAERSRALMHDVPRFAAHHRYKAVFVENVPELLKWWYFPKWIARMRALGYRHRVLTLNSAFSHQLGAPAPQLRDRVYVVFWQERYRDPDFDRWTRPEAWCPTCDQVVTAMQAPKNPKKPYGAYGAQYVFRCPSKSCRNGVAQPFVLPAGAALDWSVPGTRIGDRKRPLSDTTRARIEAGIHRYTRRANDGATTPPFITVLRTHGGNQHVTEPLRTFVAGTIAQGLVVPVHARPSNLAHPIDEPMRTQTGRHETALLVPAGGTWNEDARLVAEPMRTRTTTESEGLLTVPPVDRGMALITRHNTVRGDEGYLSTSVDEPLRTLTTAGHQSLVWNPDVLYAYDTGRFRSLGQPLPTQTTIEGDALLATAVAVDDCLFRMLLVNEIKNGMAFRPTFEMPFGPKRDRVKMCGNAVTPPVARDLFACVAEAITGEEARAA